MDNENQELKAGHPPAQKVGGMRVAQNKSHHKANADASTEMSAEDVKEFGVDKPEKRSTEIVVGGAHLSEKEAFPTQAVKDFHEKPRPTKDIKTADINKPVYYIQPRK